MTRVPPSVLWFRRDLRLGDHPALTAAVQDAGPDGGVLPLFVVDHAHERQVALERFERVRRA